MTLSTLPPSLRKKLKKPYNAASFVLPPTNFHPGQQYVFDHEARNKVVLAGRGWGKSVLLQTTAIQKCLGYQGTINPRSPQVAVILMPWMKQAIDIHWQALLNAFDVGGYLRHWVKKLDKSRYRIDFIGDRPSLLLRGVHNGEALRGINPVWAGCDEFQDFGVGFWDTVLMPALGRNHDYSTQVIGTPKGKGSYFHKFCEDARNDSDFLYLHQTTEDNPFFPKQNIESARRRLPPKLFAQEYLASWESFAGQVFTEFDDRHVTEAIPTNFRSVWLGCDWGDTNAALVVIGISADGVYYVLDSWHNTTGMTIPLDTHIEAAIGLCRKWNVYKTFCDPSRPASILAFRQAGEKHGVKGLQRSVRAFNRIEEGCQVVNSLLHQDRLYFSSSLNTCPPEEISLVDEVRSYHRAVDKDGNVLEAIAPNQFDHRTDSLRYLLASLEFNRLVDD